MNDLLFDYAQLAQWQQGDEDNSRRLRRLRRRLPDAMAELTLSLIHISEPTRP